MKSRNSLGKQRTVWFALAVLSFSVLLLAVPACKEPTTTSQSPGEQLVKASKDAGVNIHPEEVFTLSRGSETITGAPIVGWEQIPATAHANGVEFGYAYISTEEPRIPAGYYKLKGFVQASQVGTVDGRVQLIDQGGKVAAELPSQVEIHSLTVPAEAARSRSFVTALADGGRNLIWFRCPNGVCFRMPILRARVLTAVH
jgi:hypothetical protein